MNKCLSSFYFAPKTSRADISSPSSTFIHSRVWERKMRILTRCRPSEREREATPVIFSIDLHNWVAQEGNSRFFSSSSFRLSPPLSTVKSFVVPKWEVACFSASLFTIWRAFVCTPIGWEWARRSKGFLSLRRQNNYRTWFCYLHSKCLSR